MMDSNIRENGDFDDGLPKNPCGSHARTQVVERISRSLSGAAAAIPGSGAASSESAGLYSANPPIPRRVAVNDSGQTPHFQQSRQLPPLPLMRAPLQNIFTPRTSPLSTKLPKIHMSNNRLPIDHHAQTAATPFLVDGRSELLDGMRLPLPDLTRVLLPDGDRFLVIDGERVTYLQHGLPERSFLPTGGRNALPDGTRILLPDSTGIILPDGSQFSILNSRICALSGVLPDSFLLPNGTRTPSSDGRDNPLPHARKSLAGDFTQFNRKGSRGESRRERRGQRKGKSSRPKESQVPKGSPSTIVQEPQNHSRGDLEKKRPVMGSFKQPSNKAFQVIGAQGFSSVVYPEGQLPMPGARVISGARLPTMDTPGVPEIQVSASAFPITNARRCLSDDMNGRWFYRDYEGNIYPDSEDGEETDPEDA